MLYRLEEGGWEKLAEIPLEDVYTTEVLGFDGDNEGVYMLDSRGRNNPALTRMVLASGQSNVLAESIDSVLFHPQTHKPIALSFNQHQKDWHALDEAFAIDIKALESQADGDAEILATTLVQSIPPYWAGFRTTLIAAVGDPDTPPGKALLKERSPLYKAGNIKRPLLIGQGANDPRVKQSESDQIVNAMNKLGKPVTYVLYPRAVSWKR